MSKKYRVIAQWIEARSNAAPGKYPLWNSSEVREYDDGTLKIHRGKPHYLRDYPEMAFAFNAYIMAINELNKTGGTHDNSR